MAINNSQLSMRKYKSDIYERIDKFVIELLAFIKEIPKNMVNIEISKQAIRSSMSIGANAHEAQGGQTKKEFIRCFSISKREAKETQYWLMLLGKQNPSQLKKIVLLQKECDEITAIISTIIKSSEGNLA